MVSGKQVFLRERAQRDVEEAVEHYLVERQRSRKALQERLEESGAGQVSEVNADVRLLVAEPLETPAVPPQTVICAVASYRPDEIVMLRLNRQVPVSLAPLVHRFERAGEAAFRRDLRTTTLPCIDRPQTWVKPRKANVVADAIQ